MHQLAGLHLDQQITIAVAGAQLLEQSDYQFAFWVWH
jgi:hypothetical protein